MNDMTISVEMLVHDGTGLIVAVSDELKGLYVHGRTIAEVEARLPECIRALLEAEGTHVSNIEMEKRSEAKGQFVSASKADLKRTFSAELCAA